jgi:hypothetical protein
MKSESLAKAREKLAGRPDYYTRVVLHGSLYAGMNVGLYNASIQGNLLPWTSFKTTHSVSALSYRVSKLTSASPSCNATPRQLQAVCHSLSSAANG